ncbi:MAG: hypothetical protein KDA21_03100 [Phycisphaerales bacterium]|nr:hypothetical protein [Phycisphaerales bacterium]
MSSQPPVSSREPERLEELERLRREITAEIDRLERALRSAGVPVGEPPQKKTTRHKGRGSRGSESD